MVIFCIMWYLNDFIFFIKIIQIYFSLPASSASVTLDLLAQRSGSDIWSRLTLSRLHFASSPLTSLSSTCLPPVMTPAARLRRRPRIADTTRCLATCASAPTARAPFCHVTRSLASRLPSPPGIWTSPKWTSTSTSSLTRFLQRTELLASVFSKLTKVMVVFSRIVLFSSFPYSVSSHYECYSFSRIDLTDKFQHFQVLVIFIALFNLKSSKKSNLDFFLKLLIFHDDN